jgi:hypothetical protein
MLIFALRCDGCEFQVGPTGGGHTYVIDGGGERVICSHPLELVTVERVTGMSWAAASEKGLVHHAIEALCLQCAELFDAEYERSQQLDARCPRCGARDARPVRDSAGARCPRCREGTLRRDDVSLA